MKKFCFPNGLKILEDKRETPDIWRSIYAGMKFGKYCPYYMLLNIRSTTNRPPCHLAGCVQFVLSL